MANNCYLLVGKEFFIISKWEVPPYLMLAFKPEEKVIDDRGFVYYRSSAGEVKKTLDKLGLTTEELETCIKRFSIVSDEVVDSIPQYFSSEKNRRKLLGWYPALEADFPEEVGLLLRELTEEPRYTPIGHLWLLGIFCNCLEETIEITLDPNEVVQSWEVEDLRELDLHNELLFEFSEEIDAYNRLFQMILAPVNDTELLKILHDAKEDELISDIIVPLLEEIGFESVAYVTHHGAGEFGKDVRPFYRVNEFGFREYYAVQAKCVKIHSSSGRKGHVNEVIDQMKTALRMPFMDPTDNTEKKIDHYIVVTSQSFTDEARKQLEQIADGKREVMLIDDQMVAALLRRHSEVLRKIVFSHRFHASPPP